MITATGTAFLGLTIHCARCHDHKFDPITQRDYYGLQAVFAGVIHAERAVAAPDAERRRREAAALAAELAAVERHARRSEPLAQPDRRCPGRPMVNARRNVERFAAGDGPVGPPDDPGDQRQHRAVPRRSRGLYGRRLARARRTRNVGAGDGRGQGVGVLGVSRTQQSTRSLISTRPARQRSSWISREPGKGCITIAWPDPARSTASSGAATARKSIATGWRPIMTSRRHRAGHWQVVASSADRVPFEPESEPASPGVSAGNPTSAASEERAGLSARQAKIRGRLAPLGATMKVYAGTFRQPGPTHLLGPRRPDPTRAGGAAVGGGIDRPGARDRSSASRKPQRRPHWRAGSAIRPTRCRRG